VDVYLKSWRPCKLLYYRKIVYLFDTILCTLIDLENKILITSLVSGWLSKELKSHFIGSKIEKQESHRKRARQHHFKPSCFSHGNPFQQPHIPSISDFLSLSPYLNPSFLLSKNCCHSFITPNNTIITQTTPSCLSVCMKKTLLPLSWNIHNCRLSLGTGVALSTL